MKERETSKLYNSITNIKDKFIGEAQTVKVKRKNYSWARWGTIAACLCLVAATLLWLKESQTEEKHIESMEEITLAYDGDLVAERLLSSGVNPTNIRLVYAKGGDISNPADWNTLTITGEYNGRDFTLDCDFDSEVDKKDPIGAYDMTQYGDVEVAIYREESDWSDPYLYRAEFTLDGVAYALSIHSDSPEDIFAYLDMVLGEPKGDEDPS